ncbi:hypothetical protein KNO15_21990 [Leifsonia shinshuensis]|uniref:hypothetical protein n=1 Tax=Leifsonia shinshuensis TaxID=150026 RepID=UPI001F512F53|nr:hypothetical protein [Leifsonia shinshuensis]MCI0159382.1 hypothetical protein [Leifsonia shinshuensis]
MWIRSSTRPAAFAEEELPAYINELRDEFSSFYDCFWINVNTGSAIALLSYAPSNGVTAHSFNLYSWTAQAGLASLSIEWPNYENLWYRDGGDTLESRSARLASRTSSMLKVAQLPMA